MRCLTLLLSLFFCGVALSETEVTNITPMSCKAGEHNQMNGPFAIFVFCDDALGTNMSIFLKEIGAPLKGGYTLGARFWQGQSWSNDVTSFAWLKNGTELLVATSGIYGSGAVYLLDLEAKKSKVIFELDNENYDFAVMEIVRVENSKVELRFEIEHGKYKTVQIAM